MSAIEPVVLYLSKDGQSPSCQDKFSGIRRYCSSRGWAAELVGRPAFAPGELAATLRRLRPVGCVVDGVANHVDLPPRLFRGIPVSYIGYMRGRTGKRPNFHFDTAAIAEAAFRELSANRPPCYAAIGFPSAMRWSRQRVRAFRDIARAHGMACFAWPSGAPRGGASWETFTARLVPWIAGLPEHCALFAVSDQVAMHAVRAARAAARHIPRSLTLVSVDNFPELCERSDPPISSIQLDFERAGFLAAKALEEPSARAAPKAAGLAPPAPPILIPPLLVARRKSTRGHGRHEKYILEAEEIIRKEACDGLTAKALLERFPQQSRRNFERRFREATGCSVLDEILRIRLEAATTLLAKTGIAIGAVPDMCGFRSYRALDFHFRARFNMGMGEWRRTHSR